MSFSNPDGSPADHAFRALVDRKATRIAYYSRQSRGHRRRAAMLALQELAGWPVTDIATALRVHHGNVVRGLQQIRRALGESTDPFKPDPVDRDDARQAEELVRSARRESERACRDQAMLTLSLLAGWTVREISAEFGINHANVVRAIDRARRHLQRQPAAIDAGFQDPGDPGAGRAGSGTTPTSSGRSSGR